MIMKITTVELDDDPKKIKIGERNIEFSDDQVRDNDMCTYCQAKSYPACKPQCPIGREHLDS